MAAEEREKDDLLTRLRIRELLLIGLIAITAVLANLPHEYVEDTLGVNRNYLLARARHRGHHRPVPLPASSSSSSRWCC